MKRNIFTVGLSRNQSVVSAILGYIVAVISPTSKIYLEQGLVPALEYGIPASFAYWWACWKNHNFTPLSVDMQLQKDEEYFSNIAEDELEDEDWEGEDNDIQSEE